MKYRKLRIAWSVMCGILCLLLVVLWMRSYFLEDSFQLRMPIVRVGGTSAKAGLLVYIAVNEVGDRTFWITPRHENVKNLDLWATTFGTVRIYSQTSNTTVVPAAYALGLIVPHWFLVILSVAFAFLPWFRWRFSLRTLLIATTLIAVGLGLAVYLWK